MSALPMRASGLAGAVALVTAGQPAVTSAVCRALAASGCTVAVARPPDGDAGTVPDDRAVELVIPADLTDRQSTQEMAAAVAERFGRIDVLVVGDSEYGRARRAPWLEIDPAEWDRCFAAVVRAAWLSCRAVARYMKVQRSGRIVIIGCGAAWSGPPGFLQYATATSALIGVTRSLARELGELGISVNMVCPDPDPEVERRLRAGGPAAGYLPSPAPVLAAPGMGGSPGGQQAVAGSVLFLASPDSEFITGQSYLVNEGSWMQ
jgi:3-oxoacyl-[acyl-carrier protein] reductase